MKTRIIVGALQGEGSRKMATNAWEREVCLSSWGNLTWAFLLGSYSLKTFCSPVEWGQLGVPYRLYLHSSFQSHWTLPSFQNSDWGEAVTVDGLGSVSLSNDCAWLCQPSSQQEGYKMSPAMAEWAELLCKSLGRHLHLLPSQGLPTSVHLLVSAVDSRRDLHAFFSNGRKGQASPALLCGEPRPRYI